MVATITIPGMFLTGDHASRPAANAVGKGSLYACSDHTKVYQSDGSAWSDWFEAGSASGSLGAWTTYTPTLTAVTTNPTVGNGTLAGRYKELDATTVAISINWIFGSTSNAGSGAYSFALPSGMTSVARHQSLSGYIIDTSANRYTASGAVESSSTTVNRIYNSNSSVGTGITGHNAPMTWATGDQLILAGIIEIA